MAPSLLRIAVLEADTPLEQTQRRLGSYGGVFTSLLHKATDASKIPRDRLQITGWNVNVEPDGQLEHMGGRYDWKRTRGYPKLADIDAILITGSRFDAFSDDPWVQRLVQYTREAIASNRVRVIGVCFGHQIVGRALGAKVARSQGTVWEASVCQYTQTAKGKELFGGKDILNIFQMHKDLVYDYPDGVEALGSSDKCKVQGMHIKNKLITVQGHPEFTQEIVEELIKRRHEQKIFDDKMYEDTMARVGKEQDGVVVAQGFLTFLTEV